jgi:hypothetical protein
MKQTKKLAKAINLPRIHATTGAGSPHRPPEDGQFKKGEDKRRAPMGRPPGSQNKISRTMKEAVVGAVELLGSTDIDSYRRAVAVLRSV